jgi:hypothetical protein
MASITSKHPPEETVPINNPTTFQHLHGKVSDAGI